MTKIQSYLDVEVPERFEEWDLNAQVNYLSGAMDREQIADYVREVHGLDQRGEPTFLKSELAEIAAKRVQDHE